MAIFFTHTCKAVTNILLLHHMIMGQHNKRYIEYWCKQNITNTKYDLLLYVHTYCVQTMTKIYQYNAIYN